MQKLELDDIQGLILRGYGDLPAAYYVLLHIDEPAKAREMLRRIVPLVTEGHSLPGRRQALHVAFTYSGLRKLGLPEETLAAFPRAFREGMAARCAFLGDCGSSSPKTWDWGGPHTEEIDAVALLYAAAPPSYDPQALVWRYAKHRVPVRINLGEEAEEAPEDPSLKELAEDGKRILLEQLRTHLDGNGLRLVQVLNTETLIDRKEHFGFVDGISQPIIDAEQLRRKPDPENSVEPGEFILGYRGEHGRPPHSPTVAPEHDPQGLLASANGRRDFGRNGSYLVFRQLHQNVHAFWSYVEAQARRDGLSRDLLAAKMVGRWRDGTALSLAPDGGRGDLNNRFGFYDDDYYGLRCPIGSHIRRCNPRDVAQPGPQLFTSPGREDSTRITRRHRLLRRGRPYGPPLAPSMEPEDFLAAGPDDTERGLHFLCLNASLTRQFEFVQRTWVNNSKFGGLYESADPVVGMHDLVHGEAPGRYCYPDVPVRRRVRDVPLFVQTRGGAYFFMPGLRALHFLTTLG